MIDLLNEKTVPLKENDCLCDSQIDIHSHTDVVYLFFEDENGTTLSSAFKSVDEAIKNLCDYRLKHFVCNIKITEVLVIDNFKLYGKDEL